MKKIAIFFDTNIFGKPNNYAFDKGTIIKFLDGIKLSSNIDVYLPNIVVDEMKKHVKESINEDKMSKKSGYFKRGLPSNFFEDLININVKAIDDFIDKYKIKILKCSDYINIDDVNKWYFNMEKPFEINKPKEFPDAMIVLSIINFLSTSDYDESFILSNDSGFIDGIESHSNYSVYKNIGEVTKNVYLYTDEFEQKISHYILHSNFLGEHESLSITSSSAADIIEYDIGGYEFGRVDIVSVSSTQIEIIITFNIGLNGRFVVFDPYESVYDKENPECSSYIYKTTKDIMLDDLVNEVTIYLDENKNFIKYEVTKGQIIDLTDYLDQMEYYG